MAPDAPRLTPPTSSHYVAGVGPVDVDADGNITPKRTGLAALNRHERRRIHALAVKHARAQARRDAKPERFAP